MMTDEEADWDEYLSDFEINTCFGALSFSGCAGALSAAAAAKGCRAKAAMIIRERLALIFNAQLKHIKNGSNILIEGGSASLDQYN